MATASFITRCWARTTAEAIGAALRPFAGSHVGLGLRHRVLAKVEDTGRQHRTGMPFQNAVSQVLQVTHTSRGDHRNTQRITDGTGNTEVETVLHTVLVHAGEQNLASPQAFHLLRPLHRIQPGRFAPAVGEDLPARFFARPRHFLGVDGHDDALRTETVRGLADELRVEHRGSVDRDLVGTGVEQVADVLHGAHATAHGQRDEHLAGHALDGMQGGVAAIDAGGDVEEGDFVGTLLVVATGDFHRVAGITDVLELDALDHPAVVHVQARDDALGQCHGSVLSLGSCRRRPGPRRHRGCLRRWHGR